ncbi:aldo/keto reductase [Dendrothele bispora CBS 962.96]|uniref:Aldo/keto reductase n=1 Tax=Dendrothele bispora (strain CBS 962.96) TaxID=1314807 RepID=A0A4S8L760_DENBC|nr:aldo/keto reductase [Dendrothele bispora CBS 962.96]
MVSQTTKLGGTASDVTVGRVAHGLMMMTWTPNPIPDEQAFEAIKAGIDALPKGAKMILNSAEFYAMDMGTGNLQLLNRFFSKYPEYADRTFVAVKGGVKDRTPDGSIEVLRASADNIQKALGTVKKLDLFQVARIDSRVPIEQLVQNLATLVKEGKCSHIGLSECNGDTLRKANAVHPITVAEIEVSPWSYDFQQKKVIAAATELNISVLAYSPLGRGFLTGQIKSPEDLAKGDIRGHLTRFKEENMKHNFALVDGLKAIATKKGITSAQLCLAWISSLGPTMVPLPGSSKASRTLENLAAGDIVLTKEELKEISDLLAKHEVKGDRYVGLSDEQLHLWQ